MRSPSYFSHYLTFFLPTHPFEDFFQKPYFTNLKPFPPSSSWSATSCLDSNSDYACSEYFCCWNLMTVFFIPQWFLVPSSSLRCRYLSFLLHHYRFQNHRSYRNIKHSVRSFLWSALRSQRLRVPQRKVIFVRPVAALGCYHFRSIFKVKRGL